KNIDYFLKESGLQPGAYLAAKQAAAPPAAPPQTTAAAGPIRVLAVDENAGNIDRLKSLFQSNSLPAGPFEFLCVNDPHKALGNLGRWEPELVIYNSRIPGMDGIAFSQCLLLRKAVGQEIVFIGSQ